MCIRSKAGHNICCSVLFVSTVWQTVDLSMWSFVMQLKSTEWTLTQVLSIPQLLQLAIAGDRIQCKASNILLVLHPLMVKLTLWGKSPLYKNTYTPMYNREKLLSIRVNAKTTNNIIKWSNMNPGRLRFYVFLIWNLTFNIRINIHT